jgi:uncharacterized protein YcbK (DUF882 family)
MSAINIFTKGEAVQLTPNFNSQEMDCKCIECSLTFVDMDHIRRLQELREKIGPIKISSGYRCEKHNKRVGGSPKSRHLVGDATDIITNYNPAELVKLCQQFTGLGLYDTFIHLDSRATKARW